MVFGSVALGLFVVFKLFCLRLLSSTLDLASDCVNMVDNISDQDVAFFLGASAGFAEVAFGLIRGIILGVLVNRTRGRAQEGERRAGVLRQGDRLARGHEFGDPAIGLAIAPH